MESLYMCPRCGCPLEERGHDHNGIVRTATWICPGCHSGFYYASNRRIPWDPMEPIKAGEPITKPIIEPIRKPSVTFASILGGMKIITEDVLIEINDAEIPNLVKYLQEHKKEFLK